MSPFEKMEKAFEQMYANDEHERSYPSRDCTKSGKQLACEQKNTVNAHRSIPNALHDTKIHSLLLLGRGDYFLPMKPVAHLQLQ